MSELTPQPRPELTVDELNGLIETIMKCRELYNQLTDLERQVRNFDTLSMSQDIKDAQRLLAETMRQQAIITFNRTERLVTNLTYVINKAVEAHKATS